MSHIPSSAMKHAGPVHHDEAAPPKPAPKPKGPRPQPGGLGAAAWLAIGGTILVGAAAAIAVPLLRAEATPVASRRGKKANAGKPARKKSKPADD